MKFLPKIALPGFHTFVIYLQDKKKKIHVIKFPYGFSFPFVNDN